MYYSLLATRTIDSGHASVFLAAKCDEYKIYDS